MSEPLAGKVALISGNFREICCAKEVSAEHVSDAICPTESVVVTEHTFFVDGGYAISG